MRGCCVLVSRCSSRQTFAKQQLFFFSPATRGSVPVTFVSGDFPSCLRGGCPASAVPPQLGQPPAAEGSNANAEPAALSHVMTIYKLRDPRRTTRKTVWIAHEFDGLGRRGYLRRAAFYLVIAVCCTYNLMCVRFFLFFTSSVEGCSLLGSLRRSPRRRPKTET